MTGLFVFTLALLVAPKAMALSLALGSREARRGFGGAGRLLAGLRGRVRRLDADDAGDDGDAGGRRRRGAGRPRQRLDAAAARGRRSLRGRDAWRAHRGHVVLGVDGALGALLVSKYFLIWASPIFLSLTLSALLSLHTSRAGSWPA